MSHPTTLFDKIWDAHVVGELGEGWVLLQVDRFLIHDLSGASALKTLEERGLSVRNPELAFAMPDHAVSSAPGRTGETYPPGAEHVHSLRRGSKNSGIRLFDLDQEGQGIVHVSAPELGLVLPGTTLICGDSHTCTNGALGALAFGVGKSELTHALATGVLRQRKPKRMRIQINGQLGKGVTPKDLILHIISEIGADAGVEHALEYTGNTISGMDIEGRLTLCNLSVELGARSGMIAPDEYTFSYLEGRRFAPRGRDFDFAVRKWRSFYSDPDVVFDKDYRIDARSVVPTITWGTSPQHAIPITGFIPFPISTGDPTERQHHEAALKYMGLEPGEPIIGTDIDVVFIGSCTNSRLSDLRAAAAIARERHVAPNVQAWVVPGSVLVKREAEAEGLDRIFKDAGFEWREPSCSMCVAANGEVAPPGARIVSTSNRNFVGRQGPGTRTHLASPAMAAAAAIAGKIVDVRQI